MEIKLIAQTGPCRDQAVEVRSEKFFIGRDPNCQLRPEIPDLAGVHALIEQRYGLVYVRDFGAEEGTWVNDRLLRSKEWEAFDGDLIRIGPMVLTVSINPKGEQTRALKEAPPGWPFLEATASLEPGAESATAPEALESPPAEIGDERWRVMTTESVGDVLVVRPLSSDLNDETTVGPLRFDLHSLRERYPVRRVVVDLGNVAYMSSRAVGVILAYYQAVDRIRGKLRVCSVHPKVLPVLEQMRLNLLIEIFPTAEEAVRAPWD
jgi:anti-anti-sigma factor